MCVCVCVCGDDYVCAALRGVARSEQCTWWKVMLSGPGRGEGGRIDG